MFKKNTVYSDGLQPAGFTNQGTSNKLCKILIVSNSNLKWKERVSEFLFKKLNFWPIVLTEEAVFWLLNRLTGWTKWPKFWPSRFLYKRWEKLTSLHPPRAKLIGLTWSHIYIVLYPERDPRWENNENSSRNIKTRVYSLGRLIENKLRWGINITIVVYQNYIIWIFRSY